MDDPDPQVERLLERIDQQRTPPTHGMSVPTARDRLDELFTTPDPEPVGEIKEFSIEGPGGPLPVRVYAPETGTEPYGVFVTFHGGGWVVGGLDTHDPVCRALANAVECLVVSVDYRLAPEHPFPAAVEDCYAATEWAVDYADELGGDGERVAVGGDSAGGNLAAAVTLVACDRDGPELCHQSLVYPSVNSPSLQEFDSYEENAEGYLLERASAEWYYERYLDQPTDARNAYAAPLMARDLSGLPPATVITAGFDPLRDEGIAYADRLDAAGVPVTHECFEGMIHGFLNLVDTIDRSRDAIAVLADDLDEAFAD
ncbi:alpha/beta hydrolase [Halococcus qingdaonensis]|uniref:alpha/beta hydrolase n=1 Tax=Halococcus qingdaonensis TaxID=224402 RepID=UPI0021166448|nr:alpha/beta hydrolase [Halococcus qingdaonensis]